MSRNYKFQKLEDHGFSKAFDYTAQKELIFDVYVFRNYDD